MTELPFTDTDGRAWIVVDYRIQPPSGKKRVTIGSDHADGRAFIPKDWSGEKKDVMLLRFGPAISRCSGPDMLQLQLGCAYPATATALERMQPRR